MFIKNKSMNANLNDSNNPVLTFEGKKYLINELSKDIKDKTERLGQEIILAYLLL